MKLKSVQISEELHGRVKAACKGKRPRVNLGDRIEQLIRKGLAAEAEQGQSLASGIRVS
jgi:hypothetical protein